MHRKLLFPIVFLLLSSGFLSCGKQFNRESRRFKSSNPVFNEYIDKFEAHGRTYLKDANFKVGDIPINFLDPKEATVQGICTQYSDGSKEIIIRKEWWEQVSKKYHESLIFHELGHCRLGRNHRDQEYEDSDENTHKLSLMNGVLVVPGEFEKFESAYLQELFECSPTYMATHPGAESSCGQEELQASFIKAATTPK